MDGKESEKKPLGLEDLGSGSLEIAVAIQGWGWGEKVEAEGKQGGGIHCERFDTKGGSLAKIRSWSSVSQK